MKLKRTRAKSRRGNDGWERERHSAGLLLSDAEFEDYYRLFTKRGRRDGIGERDSWH